MGEAQCCSVPRFPMVSPSNESKPKELPRKTPRHASMDAERSGADSWLNWVVRPLNLKTPTLGEGLCAVQHVRLYHTIFRTGPRNLGEHGEDKIDAQCCSFLSQPACACEANTTGSQ